MEFKNRKPTRLKDYDYSSDGVYFVTICVKDRKQVLCKIVGEGLRALPKIEYTKIGTHVKNAIEYIDSRYPDIFIDNYVVMPNHIHLIVLLDKTDEKRISLGRFVGAYKSIVANEWLRICKYQ